MKKFFLVFVILIALSSCSFAAENDDVSRKLESLERQIEFLQKSVDDLSTQLNKADINNFTQYNKLSTKISFRNDFTVCLGLAINLLCLGLPFLFMCIEACRESRKAQKLIDALHEKLK